MAAPPAWMRAPPGLSARSCSGRDAVVRAGGERALLSTEERACRTPDTFANLRARPLSAARGAVAQEQEVVLLAQRAQPEAGRMGEGRSGEDPAGVAAGEQRRDGQADLVEQARRRQLAVERRPALGQHRARA